jgi:DNA primase
MAVPYLIICSSLKDIMAFTKLGYKNAEAIAPDSENTLIPEHIISAYKHKYKGICTLFDNDLAGIESMKKYKDKYDIPYVLLEMSKDLSDSVKDTSLLKVKELLTPLLKQALQ